MRLRITMASGNEYAGEFVTMGTHSTIEDIDGAIAMGLETIVIKPATVPAFLINLRHAETIEHIKEDDDET